MPWGEFATVVAQVFLVVVLAVVLGMIVLGAVQAVRGKPMPGSRADEDDADHETHERLLDMDDPRRGTL